MSSGSRSGEQTDPCTLLLPDAASQESGRLGACLVVIRGDRLGARIELDESPVVIGRGSDADFQIPSRSVSRSHCRIVSEADAFWIEDLRSTNATYVNEARIERHRLSDGDQVRIGKSVLKYLAAGNLEAGYLKELREHAVRDGLTDLYNRRHFMEVLDEAVAEAVRQRNASLVIAIIDVDYFKEINDRIGHLAGDAVLRQLARILAERVRAGDTLARIGGEEFAVLMPATSLAAAREVCERLRKAVAESRFDLGEGRLETVTISIGYAGLNAELKTVSELLKQADAYLYEAKSAGRDRLMGPGA
ncbi:MAG: GGDEF domain-containing protein [Wenzhouxiangella sp.]|nr:GGDEF domain-containing protein [Wenzhouxiangella sp.]MCH8477090.1 GGDEF domain-containing protein [Wenzhouxiangella sp.]